MFLRFEACACFHSNKMQVRLVCESSCRVQGECLFINVIYMLLALHASGAVCREPRVNTLSSPNDSLCALQRNGANMYLLHLCTWLAGEMEVELISPKVRGQHDSYQSAGAPDKLFSIHCLTKILEEWDDVVPCTWFC
jgi:hypothetical protein